MRAVVALVLLAIVTVPAQQREPAVPATPPGKLLDAWLTAFNNWPANRRCTRRRPMRR